MTSRSPSSLGRERIVKEVGEGRGKKSATPGAKEEEEKREIKEREIRAYQ